MTLKRKEVLQMNDFKQQYEGLNNKLNTSNQTLEMLEKESVEKKKNIVI